MTSNPRVVVAGGGTTAVRPAQQPGPDPDRCTATVIGEEPHAPSDRAPLVEVLAYRHSPEVIRLSETTRGAYRTVVVRGGRPAGGILPGDRGTVGALARTREGDEPLPAAPVLHLLTNDGGS